MTPSAHCHVAKKRTAFIRRLRWSLLCLSVLLQACMGMRPPELAPVEVAAHVDLDRVYGGWYIVATIPNGFEKKLIAPYDVYSPSPDGIGIREDFYVQKESFASEVKHYEVHDFVDPGTNNARWKVEFFGFIRLPFLVLYVDPDYRYILFGEENRKLGWIYSRTQLIDEPTYRSLLMQFQARGYDTTTFRKWVQRPEQIGQPGFWSDGLTAETR